MKCLVARQACFASPPCHERSCERTVSEDLGETDKKVKNQACAVSDRKQELKFLGLVNDALIVSLKIAKS